MFTLDDRRTPPVPGEEIRTLVGTTMKIITVDPAPVVTNVPETPTLYCVTVENVDGLERVIYWNIPFREWKVYPKVFYKENSHAYRFP